MAPELSMCEPRRVSGRAQRTARGLTASGSLVQIDVQLWGHRALAAGKRLRNDRRLAPCRTLKTKAENRLQDADTDDGDVIVRVGFATPRRGTGHKAVDDVS